MTKYREVRRPHPCKEFHPERRKAVKIQSLGRACNRRVCFPLTVACFPGPTRNFSEALLCAGQQPGSCSGHRAWPTLHFSSNHCKQGFPSPAAAAGRPGPPSPLSLSFPQTEAWAWSMSTHGTEEWTSREHKEGTRGHLLTP